MYKRQDTGIGISEQHQGAIFKRFYREDIVHDVDGIGIGLYPVSYTHLDVYKRQPFAEGGTAFLRRTFLRFFFLSVSLSLIHI